MVASILTFAQAWELLHIGAGYSALGLGVVVIHTGLRQAKVP